MKRMALPVTSCTEVPCGACCMAQAGLPISYYRMEGYPPDFPEELKSQIDETAKRWNGLDMWQGPADDAPCVWFDALNRRCIHYEHRPEICREFEIGSEACLSWRQLCRISSEEIL